MHLRIFEINFFAIIFFKISYFNNANGETQIFSPLEPLIKGINRPINTIASFVLNEEKKEEKNISSRKPQLILAPITNVFDGGLGSSLIQTAHRMKKSAKTELSNLFPNILPQTVDLKKNLESNEQSLKKTHDETQLFPNIIDERSKITTEKVAAAPTRILYNLKKQLTEYTKLVTEPQVLEEARKLIKNAALFLQIQTDVVSELSNMAFNKGNSVNMVKRRLSAATDEKKKEINKIITANPVVAKNLLDAVVEMVQEFYLENVQNITEAFKYPKNSFEHFNITYEDLSQGLVGGNTRMKVTNYLKGIDFNLLKYVADIYNQSKSQQLNATVSLSNELNENVLSFFSLGTTLAIYMEQYMNLHRHLFNEDEACEIATYCAKSCFNPYKKYNCTERKFFFFDKDSALKACLTASGKFASQDGTLRDNLINLYKVLAELNKLLMLTTNNNSDMLTLMTTELLLNLKDLISNPNESATVKYFLIHSLQLLSTSLKVFSVNVPEDLKKKLESIDSHINDTYKLHVRYMENRFRKKDTLKIDDNVFLLPKTGFDIKTIDEVIKILGKLEKFFKLVQDSTDKQLFGLQQFNVFQTEFVMLKKILLKKISSKTFLSNFCKHSPYHGTFNAMYMSQWNKIQAPDLFKNNTLKLNQYLENMKKASYNKVQTTIKPSKQQQIKNQAASNHAAAASSLVSIIEKKFASCIQFIDKFKSHHVAPWNPFVLKRVHITKDLLYEVNFCNVYTLLHTTLPLESVHICLSTYSEKSLWP